MGLCHMCNTHINLSTEGAVRLRSRFSASNSPAGRLEIYHNGEWGTVCENGFNQTDANVVCQQLGYDRASRYGNAGSLG